MRVESSSNNLTNTRLLLRTQQEKKKFCLGTIKENKEDPARVERQVFIILFAKMKALINING